MVSMSSSSFLSSWPADDRTGSDGGTSRGELEGQDEEKCRLNPWRAYSLKKDKRRSFVCVSRLFLFLPWFPPPVHPLRNISIGEEQMKFLSRAQERVTWRVTPLIAIPRNARCPRPFLLFISLQMRFVALQTWINCNQRLRTAHGPRHHPGPPSFPASINALRYH